VGGSVLRKLKKKGEENMKGRWYLVEEIGKHTPRIFERTKGGIVEYDVKKKRR
jgi:hypothetical protein